MTPACTDAVCGVNVIEERKGNAGLVEAGVGLPPQLTHKRRTMEIDARNISFRFFSVIIKLVAP